MRRATVESMIRWVSFGSRAMPRLPPLADHEDPVELDDRLASFVEPTRPDPGESDPEVLEKRPVLVHAIPGRKRRSKRNERCGGAGLSIDALPVASLGNSWRRGRTRPSEEHPESIRNARRAGNRMKESNSVLR